MRSGRAGRLLRRAARDGYRGRAWERLLAAGADGDRAVVDALWGAWFDGDPREELLAALLSWGRPMSGSRHRLSRTLLEDDAALSGRRRGLLIEVALVSDHPMGAFARDRIARTSEPSLLREAIGTALAAGGGRRLAAVLADRDDLPNAPVLLAELFLVTGRLDRYRALDPDGSLLATAYEGAGPDRRERMREAMLGAGDLDVVRVVAARDRVADLDVDQRRDLAHALIGTRQWEQAWRLARRLPLADAARIVRELPGDPRSGTGDAFRARLRAVPRDLDELLATLEDIAVLKVLTQPGPALAGAFSPDGRTMAVVCAKRIPRRGTATEGHAVLLVDALGGSVLHTWDSDFGRGTPDVRMTTRGIAVRHPDELTISWFGLAGQPERRMPQERRTTRLARVPGGLVAVEATPGTGIRLRRLTEDGRAAPGGPPIGTGAPFLAGLAGPPPGTRDPRPPFEVFEDAATGRIAFRHRDSGVRAVVDGSTGHVLADSRVRDDTLPAPDGYAAAGVVGGCFTAPDRIVTGRGLYRLTEDGGFTELAFVPPGIGETGFFYDPVFVPAWRELAGLSTAAPDLFSPGNVAYRSAETLEPRPGPHPVIAVHRDGLWSTPAGDVFAIGGHGGLVGAATVIRPEVGLVQELARRPLDELNPADLRILAERRHGDRPPVLQRAVDLLHDVLAASPIGLDVEIGTETAPMAGPDDIALGAP